MKRLRRAIALILIATAVVSMTAYAEPSVGQLQNDKDKAEKEIDKLEKQMTTTMKQINEVEKELVKVGSQIIQANEELEEAEEKEAAQYEAMKQRIVAMYESGNSSMIAMILEAGSVSDMLQQAENVQAIHAYDRKQLEEYVKTKEKIETLKTGLEEDMAVLEKKQKQFDKDKRSLNSKIAELEDKVDDFETRISRLQTSAYSGSSNKPSSNNSYVPPVGTGGGAAIVAEARKYLGIPYVWGGASASGADCSGLVLLAHKAIGVNLPHYSGSQGSGGKAVSASNRQPGDVVCYVGHVGVYIGGGMMIHAPQPGENIEIVSVYGSPWYRRYW